MQVKILFSSGVEFLVWLVDECCLDFIFIILKCLKVGDNLEGKHFLVSFTDLLLILVAFDIFLNLNFLVLRIKYLINSLSIFFTFSCFYFFLSTLSCFPFLLLHIFLPLLDSCKQ